MRKVLTLGILISCIFLTFCASPEYAKMIEGYYKVEVKRIALAEEILKERTKSANKDLFTLDLNKDGTIDKIHVAKQYLPVDPVVASTINRQLPMPKDPQTEFWREFFGFGKSVIPLGLGAWALTEVVDSVAESAGNHSVNNSRNYEIGDEGTVATDHSEIDVHMEDNDVTTTTTTTTTDTTTTNTGSGE